MELENYPNLSCILCNRDFTSENDMIVHINSSEHLTNKANKQENNENISAVLSELFCDVCRVAVPCAASMDSHIKGRKHLKQLRILEKKKKAEMNCGVFIRGFAQKYVQELLNYLNTFGTVEWHLVRHNYLLVNYETGESATELMKEPRYFHGNLLTIKHRLKKQKEQPIVDTNDKSNSNNFENIVNQLLNVKNFNEQIAILLKNLKPDLSKYHVVCSDINASLLKTFPNNRVHLFGSTITGLNFINSDIDVYISGVRYNDNDQVKYLFKTRNILENSSKFGEIVVIKTAKTPILKCTHLPLNIKVDINFRSMLCVCNSYLIASYTNLDEKIRIMFIIIKYWAKCRKIIGDNSSFTSYVLCILAIFYLQCQHNLPSVFMLQQNCREDIHEGWNGTVTPISKHYTPKESVFELLKGFFKFYVDFDYETQVICPYLGRSFNKIDFLEKSDSSQWFKPIVITNRSLLNLTSLVCIQDPMEHTRNPTTRISPATLNLFVKNCELCYNICEYNTECLLYKLLTTNCDVNPTSVPEFYTFTVFMVYVNTPSYLAKLYPSTTDLRRSWCNAVVDFAKTVFKDFFRFQISEILDDNLPSSSKHQKVDGQDDVYSQKCDKIVFNCSGKLNVWSERNRISKYTSLQNKNATLVEKEKTVTATMFKTFGSQAVDNLINFNVSIDLVMDPCQVKFDLSKIYAYKRAFATFANYFIKTFPGWLRVHENDLNKMS